MPNYADGKIYCIRDRSNDDKIVYVGSTTQTLANRMCQHRRSQTDLPTMKLYALFASVGVEHFHIELIADFPCERKEQLLKEEGRHIRLHNLTIEGCNTCIAGRSKKDWAEENKNTVDAYQKQYRVDHKEQRNDFQKSYREANREKVEACKKTYNEEQHKEERLAYFKARYERDRDAMKAAASERRDTKRDEINAKLRAYRAANKNAINSLKRERYALKKALLVNGAPSIVS